MLVRRLPRRRTQLDRPGFALRPQLRPLRGLAADLTCLEATAELQLPTDLLRLSLECLPPQRCRLDPCARCRLAACGRRGCSGAEIEAGGDLPGQAAAPRAR